MNRALRQALEASPQGRALLAAQEQEKRDRRARAKALRKRGRAPGPTRERRRAEDDARELAGKAAAMRRAGGRCEVHEKGARCDASATDAHHAIGGRWKRDVESLPNGEGFIAACRLHHDLLLHGPDRAGAIHQAWEHAIRVGSRCLRRLVDAAAARYHAKHPEGR